MKSGFALIEIVVALAVISLLSAFECGIFIKNLNWYHSEMLRSQENSYSEEFFYIFEKVLYEDMKEVKTENNEVVIKCMNGKHRKVAYSAVTGRIFAYYYDESGNDRYGAVVIRRNVKNMTANTSGNILYIDITDNKGETLKKCFGIRKIY